MLSITSRLNFTRTLGSTVMLGIMLFVPAATYAADIIIDNKDPGASWSNVPGWYGQSITSAYKSHAQRTASKNAWGTFKFGSLASGKYDVYMHWPNWSGTLPDNAAPVIIKHSSGTQTVTVNQQQNGGKWNRLGSWTLDNTAYLTLTNRGNGRTYFDAIKLVPSLVTPPQDPTLSLTANPVQVSTGGAATLSWASQSTTSCTASGGWSGNKGLSGSQTVSKITSSQTYNLTCTGTTKNVSAVVNVVVALPPPPPPPAQSVVGLNVQQHMGTFDAAGQAFTKELGAHSIRIGYGVKHDFGINWAAQNGKSVVFMLGYGEGINVKTPSGRQAYADRSAGLAQKYGNKIKYYQIWNEFNGSFGPYGDYAQNKSRFVEYTDLLCKTYSAVKAVQPSAIVTGGPLSGANEDFLRGMLDNGAGNCMDMMSLHLYVYRQDWPGHVASDAPGSVGADKFIEVITDRENLLEQKTGRTIPILVSETGFHGDDEQLEADYLTELYRRAAAVPFLEGIWWFSLEDAGKGDFGLLRSNNTKKLSFAAFRAAAE